MGDCVSLVEAIADIAEALRPLRDEIPDLQIYPYWADDPTPPCIDLFPGTPFQNEGGFGRPKPRVYLTIRARVGMADPLSAQALLMRLLDPTDAASVEGALYEVGVGTVEDGVSGFTQYTDDTSTTERMLGCEWRVSRFL